MDSHSFVEFLKKNQKGNYAYHSSWPDNINVSSQVRDTLKTLFRYTSKDKHEYESTLFHVNRDTFLTPPFRGDRSSVKINHNLETTIKQKSKDYVERIIKINGKILNKTQIKISKFENKISSDFLFNIHTHPPHNDLGKTRYSFFSEVDFNTLLTSNRPALGLITDEFWIACKTKSIETTNINDIRAILQKMYSANIYFTDDSRLIDIIKKEFKRIGIIFYTGDLNSRFYKIT